MAWIDANAPAVAQDGGSSPPNEHAFNFKLASLGNEPEVHHADGNSAPKPGF